MNRADALLVLTDIVAAVAPDADLAAVDPAGNLREQLDIDSMDFLRIVTALNDRTGVAIPEADYRKVQSLDALLAYIVDGVGR